MYLLEPGCATLRSQRRLPSLRSTSPRPSPRRPAPPPTRPRLERRPPRTSLTAPTHPLLGTIPTWKRKNLPHLHSSDGSIQMSTGGSIYVSAIAPSRCGQSFARTWPRKGLRGLLCAGDRTGMALHHTAARPEASPCRQVGRPGEPKMYAPVLNHAPARSISTGGTRSVVSARFVALHYHTSRGVIVE
jgi:hypothetical protein